MKRISQIVLATLIVVKIVLGTIFIYRIELGPWFAESSAIASETQPASTQAPKIKQPIKTAPAPEKDSVIKRMAALRAEEKALEKKKAELLAIQENISKKIDKLRQIRSEIRSHVVKQKSTEDGKVKHLIKAYSTMKPQKSATLIEKLELDFAIKLLSRMKGDVVGNILSFVDAEKAARISQELIKDR